MEHRRCRAATVLVAGALVWVPLFVSAQDVAAVNPKTVHVKLENDKVRVLEAELPPGLKEQIHHHPASVVYVIAGGKIRNHAADGSTSDRDLAPGETYYRDPLTHWTENVGTTTIHLILVELKSTQGAH